MAYFPNGTSTGILEQQCDDCRLSNDDPCPILLVQMTWNYVQVDNKPLAECLESLVNEEGICQMKPLIDKIGVK